MKFLIQKIGLDAFNELVAAEQKALPYHSYPIDTNGFDNFVLPTGELPAGTTAIQNPYKFEIWKKTNLLPQKQKGYYAVYVRVPIGDIESEVSRRLIEKLRPVIADDVRITVNQGLQFRFVKPEHLEYVYSVLESENLAEPGFGSTADITACPGTDTCNLGISNSTGISKVLSEVIDDEFPEFLYNKEISIKISGCMNSCGQHGIAAIGFHGSSLKAKGKVLPALQVLIGGGSLGAGEARVADKVIKVPSKRGPEVLRVLLNDYKNNAETAETYLSYTARKGERYFYDVLKPLTSLETLQDEDYMDWGHEEKYSTAIGVGECAGVVIDLVATLILEGEEKLELSSECLKSGAWADSIYHSYASFVNTAKGLLLGDGVQCNTQNGILRDFDTHFTQKGFFSDNGSFQDLVLQINKNEPTETFAIAYHQRAKDFIEQAKEKRSNLVEEKAV